MRNKQVVLLIAGISGIVTGIIVSLNIPFIRQGLFYPASPVEIVVSLCLTFSVSVVFFVGAIVGCVFRSIRSRIGIEVRSAIRIHSINRELNFFYRFLTRFCAAFHYRGIFPQ
ncbi:TPA: hypothetical protein ACG349_004945 [Escherichia coli]